MRLATRSALIVLALSVACSATSTEVVSRVVLIEPTAAIYHSGDSLWVDLRNVGDRDVAYGSCGIARQRASGDAWVSQGALPVNCADALALLRAGESVRLFIETVPSTLTSGLYRYQFETVEVDDNRLPESDRQSQPFRVGS